MARHSEGHLSRKKAGWEQIPDHQLFCSKNLVLYRNLHLRFYHHTLSFGSEEIRLLLATRYLRPDETSYVAQQHHIPGLCDQGRSKRTSDQPVTAQEDRGRRITKENYSLTNTLRFYPFPTNEASAATVPTSHHDCIRLQSLNTGSFESPRPESSHLV